MKRYVYNFSVESAAGYQQFYVDAESREEADYLIDAVGGNIYASEVDVEHLGAPEFEMETTLDDFGDFKPHKPSAMPTGWEMVPVVPTESMLSPFDPFMRPAAAKELFALVLAAAPQPDYHEEENLPSAQSRIAERESELTALRQAQQESDAWAAGDKPSEYGRYYVRYLDSDGREQFTIADWTRYNFCAGGDNTHDIWLDYRSRTVRELRGVTHYTELPHFKREGEHSK